MSKIISDKCTLLTNHSERCTAEQAATCAIALAEGKLAVRYVSGVQGPEDEQWVETRADYPLKGSYTLVFAVRKDILHQLWIVLTPTGKCYSIDKDGGNPASFLKQEHWQALTALLVPKTNVIEIKTFFQILKDGRPVGPGDDLGPSPQREVYPKELTYGKLFESEEEAEKMRQRFCDYWSNVLTRKVVQPPKTKKAQEKAGLR